MPDSQDKTGDAPKQEKPQTKAELREALEDEKFSVERLIAESADFFGHPPHVAAGAFHDGKQNYTLDEAKARVDKFLKQPVEQDDPNATD